MPKDTDQLLTGGGSMAAEAVSVDAIAVDYAESAGQLLHPGRLHPPQHRHHQADTSLTVGVGRLYRPRRCPDPRRERQRDGAVQDRRSPSPIPPTPSRRQHPLASGTLYLDYNDIGISSMEVVEENEGERTVQVTLYNDSAAKLEGSGRTVELSFYTDSEYTDARQRHPVRKADRSERQRQRQHRHHQRRRPAPHRPGQHDPPGDL